MRCKVLMVTNEDGVPSYAESVCRQEGLDVVVSHDGLDAVLRAVSDRPDLLVFDSRVPPVGSLSVPEVFTRDRRLSAVPIIVLLAHADKRERAYYERFAKGRVVEPNGHGPAVRFAEELRKVVGVLPAPAAHAALKVFAPDHEGAEVAAEYPNVA